MAEIPNQDESTTRATLSMEQPPRTFIEDAEKTVQKLLRTLEALPTNKLECLSQVLEFQTKKQLQKLWTCLSSTLADDILLELGSMSNNQRRLLLGRAALRQLSIIANVAIDTSSNNVNLCVQSNHSLSGFEYRRNNFGIHDACLPDLASGLEASSVHGVPPQNPDESFEPRGQFNSNVHSVLSTTRNSERPSGYDDSDAAHFLLLLSENKQRILQSSIHSVDWLTHLDGYEELLEEYVGINPEKFSIISQTDGWREQLQETLVQNLLRVGLTFPGLIGPGANLSSSIRHYVDTIGKFQRLVNSLYVKEGLHPWTGSPPAATWILSTLPYIQVDHHHLQSGLGNCTICRENLGLHSIARQLPCSHLYHHSCIVQWLSRRNSCPVCRFELPTDDLNYELDHHHSWISNLPAEEEESFQ